MTTWQHGCLGATYYEGSRSFTWTVFGGKTEIIGAEGNLTWAVERYIGELSSEGWELVSVVSPNAPVLGDRYYFKRRVGDRHRDSPLDERSPIYDALA